MDYKLDVAIKYKAILGEGPVWDERRNLLFWVDSLNDKACVFNPETGENKVYEMGQNIGTLVLTERDDEVLVGLVDGLYILNLDTGALTFKVDPEAGIEGNRLNDGKADIRGRLWIGSMCVADNGGEGYDTDFKCNLHRVDADYTCTVVDPEIRLSNGMVWTEDQKTMYYIDSPTCLVYQYDYDVEKGVISNRRGCVTIPAEFGIGDGMDIDTDGNLWIAHYTGWCVGKWDPRTGELLGKIELPVSRITSCAFGGENHDLLYIVTASIGAKNDAKPQPEAGYTFVASGLGVKGKPFYRFGG